MPDGGLDRARDLLDELDLRVTLEVDLPGGVVVAVRDPARPAALERLLDEARVLGAGIAVDDARHWDTGPIQDVHEPECAHPRPVVPPPVVHRIRH